MADEYEADAAAGGQLAHEIQHLRLDRNVETGERLVRHDHPGFQHHRAGNRDPLLLAARKLVRIAWEILLRRIETDGSEMTGKEGAQLGRLSKLVATSYVGERLLHAHTRIERRRRVLKDRLDVAPVSAPLLAIQVSQRNTSIEHDAVGRLLETQHKPGERALARPRLADDSKRLALVDVEIDPVDRVHNATAPTGRDLAQIATRELAALQNWFAHGAAFDPTDAAWRRWRVLS